MMIKFTVLKVGEKPADVEQYFDSAEPGYHALRDVIEPYLDGAHMEHVSVLHDGERRDMFVDDDGQAKGLPVNKEATEIYRANWMKHHPTENPNKLPDVVGTAILFHQRVWN